MLTGGVRLLADLDVEARPDAPIGAETWYGVGGHADLLVSPRSIEAAATLLKRCRRARTIVRVLGRGANLLVSDEGVGGVVMRLDAEPMREWRFNASGPVSRVHVMAGADLPKLIMETARRGLGGLEGLAGIPATIGGAIRMNAGGRFGSIADAVESITVVDRRGEIVERTRDEIPFGYRTSGLDDPLVLAATLRLEQDDPVRLRDAVKSVFAYKKSTQPLAAHSAGCTFRNPIDPSTEQQVPAGKLIDEAGCKGRRIGGAEVSEHHANFIVTHPGASAEDVRRLMNEVRDRVAAHSGIRLEDELVVWRREGAADPGATEPQTEAPRGVLDLDPAD